MLDFSAKPLTPQAPSSSSLGRLLVVITTLGVALALMTQFRQTSEPTPAATAESPSTIPIDPTFDPSQLESFVDHARSIDPTSYYYLLDRATKADPTPLYNLPAKQVSYAQLLDEPERYRGIPVHLIGRLHRLVDYRAQPNPYDIKRQYEGWLYSTTSGSLPYCLVMAHQPASVPLGENIFEQVEAVGYFLGWWRYQTKEGKRTSAPIIMVTELRSRADQKSAPPPAPWKPPHWLGWLLLGIASGIVAIRWWRRRPATPTHRPSPPAEDLVFDEKSPDDDSA
jgi:hypothetical protein